MGTRCGDIDPGLLPFLSDQGMSIKDIDTLMNKQSGLLGLSGHNDWRSVSEGARDGDERCQLASGARSSCPYCTMLPDVHRSYAL
jgi:acetate kinase